MSSNMTLLSTNSLQFGVCVCVGGEGGVKMGYFEGGEWVLERV